MNKYSNSADTGGAAKTILLPVKIHQAGEFNQSVQQQSDSRVMSQQLQQKQYQQEPQQQSDGKVINTDTPDSPLTDHEQPYVSKSYQINKKAPQEKQNPQEQSSPAMDVVKARWQKHMGAAKVVWGKLTDDELLQSAGEIDKLSGLVRERYALSRYEADRQVKNFFDKCK